MAFCMYLRYGSGAAPPSVQHDGVFMPFLQHFILKNETLLEASSKILQTNVYIENLNTTSTH